MPNNSSLSAYCLLTIIVSLKLVSPFCLLYYHLKQTMAHTHLRNNTLYLKERHIPELTLWDQRKKSLQSNHYK
ncbi:MAG: hypothetical protein WBQ73_00960 [Candidatus Babeliales bacterium]